MVSWPRGPEQSTYGTCVWYGMFEQSGHVPVGFSLGLKESGIM